ncbi:nonselective cation channel [Hirsutella rhossiliensis]|uniref:Nonselective cation channel n=1 Tax=Hirsutella rhossiliensis TaxID=111463 RepID=A0A9P8N365_9HYPO|nr:nonselective cation channel [Hirsutella rhossiliensis]KAH0965995.1 nonselective cation channel [Hirsutella rhossiliensis]
MDPADDCATESEPCLSSPHGHFSSEPLPVYVNIHRVRRLVLVSIDDPYTIEHFREPALNSLLVRPLVERLYDPQDTTVVYSLLANRVYFLREQSGLVHQNVNVARATLCELVASRVLRRFHEDNPGPAGLLLVAHNLLDGLDPFQGASSDVEREGRHLQWPIQERGGQERKLTALELAILSESKAFISSAACQRVVDAVHSGRVIYTPLSFVDVLPDHYKYRPMSLYNPRDAPLLNHYRLIVPRIRAVVELVQYLVLLAFYVLTMIHRHRNFNRWELVFAIYTAGWVLQEFAAIIEHGWEVHTQNLWAFLDITFVIIYSIYVPARLYDLSIGHLHDGIGLHILCISAPVLLTRIAFNLMPHSIVFISLHAMMKDFTVLTFLALWCFAGFLLALQWLSAIDSSNSEFAPSWSTVGKWLLWIWFGLDGTGIEESINFHVILGPTLMVSFAFLGNTLFLTILVAILTNTFSTIIANEAAEIRFRRTVLTFEGVKSDSIFAYPPPFNILALVILLPLKFVVTSRFSPHGDVLAVLKSEPPEDVVRRFDELDPLDEIQDVEVGAPLETTANAI